MLVFEHNGYKFYEEADELFYEKDSKLPFKYNGKRIKFSKGKSKLGAV